jgi:tetratricopeptide (TPR) repeat protein
MTGGEGPPFFPTFRGRLPASLTRLLCVAVVLLPGASIARASAVNANAVKAFHEYQFGEAALASGNRARAARSFDKALDLFPPFPEAHLGKGRIALAERRFQDALVEFESARDSYSQAGDSLMDLRMVRYHDARRKADEVRQEMAELESRLSFAGGSNGTNQNDPGLHDHMIGGLTVSKNASTTSRHLDLLAEELTQLEAIAPPRADRLTEVPGEVFFYVGNALFNLGRIEEAKDAWISCTERSPLFPYAYDNLAVALWKLGRIPDAVSALDRAQSLGLNINTRLQSDLRSMSSGALPPSSPGSN